MLIPIRKAFLIIGLMLSSASLADDARTSEPDREPQADVPFSVETFLAASWYESRWELTGSVNATANSGDWSPGTADFDLDFQDNSTLARVSRLDNLSLLTLAEVGTTRVFLGVNDDGLVGLHFDTFRRAGDERYLEVLRMPYLKDGEAGEEP